jgi:hypothetical protein
MMNYLPVVFALLWSPVGGLVVLVYLTIYTVGRYDKHVQAKHEASLRPHSPSRLKDPTEL